METLEPNMYVRTKNHNGFAGGVGKIEKIQDDKTHKTKWITLDRSLDGISFLVNISEITKASHNIIDLIEVGDYVNGHKVEEVIIDALMSYVKLECVGLYVSDYEDVDVKDIKTIVTSQQFESIMYKVER